MAEDTDALLDATTALIPSLLTALEALSQAGRQLHPPDLDGVARQLAPFREPLKEGLRHFESVSWPEHLGGFEASSRRAAGHALQALDAWAACLEHSNPAVGAYRAMGSATRAVEALYPVAFMLPPVNRFYLCEAQREDTALQERLLQSDSSREDLGVLHAGNAEDQRGGFSLYVPEYHDPRQPAPLVVALHGGNGHGRTFLWSWLREARSRGVLLLAPTARGETWSLMGPDVDTANLQAMLAELREHYAIDERRLLLTGMSDGGTFSYVAGLPETSPFTHLAPIAASFHPLLLEGSSEQRLEGLPVYLVHGTLDWMFAVEMARMARDAMGAAGADVTYREIQNLSHTYPREENARILDWLLA